MKITLVITLLTLLSVGCFGQSTRLEDHSDWWSILNEDVPEQNLIAQKGGFGARNLTIAGLSLEKDGPKQVQNTLGRGKSVERGDAASGRTQLCYVSSKGTEKLYLIFEYGEVEATFYLFAGERSWHGQEFCTSSEKISGTLSTPSGLRLGLSRKQVEAILGKPDMVTGNRFVYFRQTEKKTTTDTWTVQTYIEAKFTDSSLNYLVVSTSSTN